MCPPSALSVLSAGRTDVGLRMDMMDLLKIAPEKNAVSTPIGASPSYGDN